MAGEMSKKERGAILFQAMLAQKNIKPQLDRLLQLRRRLEQQPSPSDDNITAGLREFALDVEHIYPAFAAGLNDLAVMRMDFADAIKHVDLAPEICKVYFAGVRAGARAIHACLQLAANTGGRLARNPAFAAMPEDELFDALVAQQLPAHPTTQTEAFDLVEAAFYALKLSRNHHLPRCVEHLTCRGIRPPPLIGEPEDDSSENEDDPVDAATEHLAKTDHSDPAPVDAATEHLAKTDHSDPAPAAAAAATEHLAKTDHSDPAPAAAATEHLANTDLSDPAPAAAATEHLANTDLSDPAPAAAATGEPFLASFKSSMDHDKACTYLDRGCTLWSLAVEHIDLAVAVISSFLDPKEVASLSDYTDRVAYAESIRTDRLHSF